ncbi:MAG TPA: class I SAM-dependent methyltransferase [Stellaceae bacterium]|nr:class I SAM-dependent methyltransferase [Stellaceae bacterium]
MRAVARFGHWSDHLITYTNPAEYDRFMGRWSARLAPHFAIFVGQHSGRVLDVGCGTGVLTRALINLYPRIDVVGVDPADSYIEYASRMTPSPGVQFQRGAAESLPFADASFDAVLSLLILQELSDAPRAVREMVRVTREGGCVATSKWDFRDGMPMLSLFWQAAEAVAPQAVARRRAETGGPSLYASADELAQLWRECGLTEVRTAILELEMEFDSFHDFWLPFCGGATGTAAFARDLDESTGGAVATRLRQMIGYQCCEGRFTLTARAWAVSGRSSRG